MTTRFRQISTLVATGLIAVAGTGLAPTAGSAATPAVRYVSPTGSGDCSIGSPCELIGAIAASATGDVVELAPGTYPATGSYNSTIENSTGVIITGQPGAAPPLINSAAAFTAVDLVNGASISNVTINFTGDQYGLELDGASASHVTVVANSGYSGPNGAACSVGGDPDPSVLTDSLCIRVTHRTVATSRQFFAA